MTSHAQALQDPSVHIQRQIWQLHGSLTESVHEVKPQEYCEASKSALCNALDYCLFDLHILTLRQPCPKLSQKEAPERAHTSGAALH